MYLAPPGPSPELRILFYGTAFLLRRRPSHAKVQPPEGQKREPKNITIILKKNFVGVQYNIKAVMRPK